MSAEDRFPFQDDTLQLFDPRLFPTKKSVAEFVGSDEFVGLMHAIERAMLLDDYVTCEDDHPMLQQVREAAAVATLDACRLVCAAMGSSEYTFDRSKDPWEYNSRRDRVEALSYLTLVVSNDDGPTMGPYFADLAARHIASLKRSRREEEEDAA